MRVNSAQCRLGEDLQRTEVFRRNLLARHQFLQNATRSLHLYRESGKTAGRMGVVGTGVSTTARVKERAMINTVPPPEPCCIGCLCSAHTTPPPQPACDFVLDRLQRPSCSTHAQTSESNFQLHLNRFSAHFISSKTIILT